MNAGVNDRLQVPQRKSMCRGGPKHLLGEPPTIDAAVGSNHTAAEPLDDKRLGLGVEKDLVGDPIGVDDPRAKFGEAGGRLNDRVCLSVGSGAYSFIVTKS